MTKKKKGMRIMMSLMMMLGVLSFSGQVFAEESTANTKNIGEVEKVETQKADSLIQRKTQNTTYKNEFLQVLKTSSLKKDSLNICIYDDFITPQNRGDNTTFMHGDVVKGFIENYLYDIEGFQMTELESADYDFFNGPYPAELMNCDVMNVSMVFTIHDLFKQPLITGLDGYLGNTNTLMIVSSGNDSADTKKQTVFSFYNDYRNNGYRNDFWVIGQLEKKNGQYVNNLSYGKEIDFMVANQWEAYGNYRYAGTSFASPVMTATVSNLMLAGLTKEEIKQSIAYSQYKDSIRTYPVFAENETYRNALVILREKEAAAKLIEENKKAEATSKLYNAVRYLERKYFYGK